MTDHLLQRSDVVACRYFVVWKATSSEQRAAVSAGERELLVRSSRLQAIRVGRCSGGLICRIVGAAARAYAAQFTDLHGRRECNNNSDPTTVLAAAE